jgi:hypothetical protein
VAPLFLCLIANVLKVVRDSRAYAEINRHQRKISAAHVTRRCLCLPTHLQDNATTAG